MTPPPDLTPPTLERCRELGRITSPPLRSGELADLTRCARIVAALTDEAAVDVVKSVMVHQRLTVFTKPKKVLTEAEFRASCRENAQEILAAFRRHVGASAGGTDGK